MNLKQFQEEAERELITIFRGEEDERFVNFLSRKIDEAYLLAKEDDIEYCFAPSCPRYRKEKGYICNPSGYCRECNKRNEKCVCRLKDKEI